MKTRNLALPIGLLAVVAAGAAIVLYRPDAPPPESPTSRPEVGSPEEAATASLGPDLPLRPAGVVVDAIFGRNPVADVRLAPESIRLSIRLPREPDSDVPPTLDSAIALVLPPDREVFARIVGYSVGDRAVSIRPETDPSAPQDLGEGIGERQGLQLKTVGVLRRWRIGALRLLPEFQAPYTRLDRAEWEDLIAEIEIRWSGPLDPATPASHPGEADPSRGWGRTVARLVANPEAIAPYQIATPPLREDVAPNLASPFRTVPGERRWARLPVEAEGLHRIDPDDLIAVGFPPAEIVPANLRLFRFGAPVPLLRRDGKIYVWNPKPTSKYSRARVYWATLAPDLPDPALPDLDPQLVAGTPDLVPNTLREAKLDRDNLIRLETGLFLAVTDMVWVDAPIPLAGTLDAPLPLPAYAPTEAPLDAELRIRWEEPRGPRTHIRLAREDGGFLAEAVSDSAGVDRLKMTIAPGELSDGANALRLSRTISSPDPMHGDEPTTIWLDSIRLEYPARPSLVDGRTELRQLGAREGRYPAFTPLDEASASDHAGAIAVAVSPKGEALGLVRPVRLAEGLGYLWPSGAGHRVAIARPDAVPRAPRFERVVPDDLIGDPDTPPGADYLIVAHREFMEETRPLVEAHEKRGRKTRLIDVQAVFDNFADGEPDPRAIRDFLAHAATKWNPPPTHVLFVGDCTSDYLNETKSEVRNWVPTYSRDMGHDVSASDHWFAAFAGDDDLADVFLGRFSVSNREDARAVVEKTIAYMDGPPPGPWRARVGYVSDDGGFVQAIEELRKDRTPPAWMDETVYLDQEAILEDNWYLPQQFVAERKLKVSPLLTWRIRRLFEEGAGYLCYYGHGSPNIWMDERVWFGGNSADSDNLELAPTGRMPFVATMTCNTGAIDYPIPKGLPGVRGGGWNINISEDMMRVPMGGAIGLFVPSGPEGTTIQHRMALELQRALFGDELRSLGEATTLARARYTVGDGPDGMLHMYILLGDPALELAMETDAATFDAPAQAYRPGDRFEATLTGADPPQGRFVAELRLIESGKTLWRGEEATYRGGRIPLGFAIPEDAPLERAALRVYAWNDAGEGGAAACEFEIARPDPRVEAARVEPEGAGGERIVVELANRSGLATRDAEIRVEDATTSPAIRVASAPLSLDAGATTTLAFALPPADERARVLEVAVDTKEPAPRGGSGKARLRIARRPAPDRAALVPGLGRYLPPTTGQIGRLDAAAVLPTGADPGDWLVGLDAGTSRTLASLPLAREAAQSGVGRAEFSVLPKDMAQGTTGTIWLARRVEAGDPERIDETPLAAFPVPRPRLRIVPGSVSTEPAAPFEGQTVLVRFAVENLGDPQTQAGSVALYDRDPALGAQPVYDHVNGVSTVQIQPPLGAGERRDLVLRWDPTNNAGAHELRVRLDPGREGGRAAEDARAAAADPDLNAVAKVYVRRKADLPPGLPTLVKESPNSVPGAPKLEVSTEVVNRGEVDAVNVKVVFYRSDLKVPGNEIGETVLPLVPAGGSAVARIEWAPSREEFVPGMKLPNPTHRFRLNWRREFATEE